MQAVVFDIDGTLLQSATVDDDLYREAVRDVLGDVFFRESLAAYDHVSDSGILEQVFADNGIALDEERVGTIKLHFTALIESHIRQNGPFLEFPGAMRQLEYYRQSSLHFVAIATGGWRRTATLKLETAGFNVADIPLASADDAKDRVEIMLHAVAAAGAELNSVTYFGDGTWDKVACDQLGWNFVAVGPVLGGISSFDELPT